MGNDNGWIKLNRSVTKLPFWPDPEKAKAYIDLLLMTNYKDNKITPKGGNSVVTIKRGQVFTSIESLQGRWNWSKKRVVGYIKMLERLNLCTAKGHTYGTIITMMDTDFGDFEGPAKVPTKVPAGVSAGVPAKGTPNGPAGVPAEVPHYKKDKKDKNTNNPRNKQSAQRPGGIWGGEPE